MLGIIIDVICDVVSNITKQTMGRDVVAVKVNAGDRVGTEIKLRHEGLGLLGLEGPEGLELGTNESAVLGDNRGRRVVRGRGRDMRVVRGRGR
jgi:hypothetical protein